MEQIQIILQGQDEEEEAEATLAHHTDEAEEATASKETEDLQSNLNKDMRGSKDGGGSTPENKLPWKVEEEKNKGESSDEAEDTVEEQ